MKSTALLLLSSTLLLFSGCGMLRPGLTGGNSRPNPTSAIRTDIATHAQELMGTRYKYAGNKPTEGFDCSGFVRYLYQNAGLDLERVSRDQAKQGRLVRLEEARPGDLVFFRQSKGQGVFHVSLIVKASPAELWVIHSTTSRGVIRENVLASSYWRPKIYQVRDVLN